MNGYEYSRAWFDFAFENPEKISPSHGMIYFYAIEHCNKLGWKEKFGFPAQLVMDAVGIRKHSTYVKYFKDLVDWGFFNLIQKSTNQWSANIISLSIALPKNGNALSKAIANHTEKQPLSIGISNVESTGYIDKPINQKPINDQMQQQCIILDEIHQPPKQKIKRSTKAEKIEKAKSFMPPTLDEVKIYFIENAYSAEQAIKAFHWYDTANWFDKKGDPVLNWKQKMRGIWMTAEHKIETVQERRARLEADYMARLGKEAREAGDE